MFRKSAILAAIFVAGCTAFVPDEMDSGLLTFVEPIEGWRDAGGACIAGQTCWSDMTRQQVLRRITLRDSSSAVYKKNRDGTLSYLGAGARVGRGEYRLERHFAAYLNTPCQPEHPERGMQRIGVGVRVIADLKTRARRVDLGSLRALGAAAKEKEVSGSIRVRTWGITTSDQIHNARMMSGSVPLDEAGVEAAVNTLRTGEEILGDGDTTLSPATFAIVESAPNSCRQQG